LTYINADYTLTLSRLPDGEFIGLAGLTHYSHEGVATGTATAWEFYPSDIVPAGANTANPVTFPVKDGTSLFGDNAWVYADVNDDNRANAGEEIPAASGTDWSRAALLNTTDGSQSCSTARPCTWDSHTPFSWQANMAQNGAQVMYYLNKFHDHLEGAPYGFTGASSVLRSTPLIRTSSSAALPM